MIDFQQASKGGSQKGMKTSQEFDMPALAGKTQSFTKTVGFQMDSDVWLLCVHLLCVCFLCVAHSFVQVVLFLNSAY